MRESNRGRKYKAFIKVLLKNEIVMKVDKEPQYQGMIGDVLRRQLLGVKQPVNRFELAALKSALNRCRSELAKRFKRTGANEIEVSDHLFGVVAGDFMGRN